SPSKRVKMVGGWPSGGSTASRSHRQPGLAALAIIGLRSAWVALITAAPSWTTKLWAPMAKLWSPIFTVAVWPPAPGFRSAIWPTPPPVLSFPGSPPLSVDAVAPAVAPDSDAEADDPVADGLAGAVVWAKA